MIDKRIQKYWEIIKIIQLRGPIDQGTVAKSLDMGIVTVNRKFNDLQKLGVIVKSGKTESRSGRKSNLYILNPQKHLAVGIALNEERLILCAAQSDGNRLYTDMFNFRENNDKISTDTDLINILMKYYREFLLRNKIAESAVSVLGIAPEGIIDTKNGRCILGTHLGGVIDLQLGSRLGGLLRIPIYIDDPARSLAYYAEKFSPNLRNNNFIYIYIKKGIGSGIVINGRIYRGFKGIAGEIGHIVISKNGPRCKCGNSGCLETVASEESIIRQLKEGVQNGVFSKINDYCIGNIDKVDLSILKKAADVNDKFAMNIIENVGNHLGKALAMLVNVFNPAYILLGGSGSILGNHLRDSVIRIIRNETLDITDEKTAIEIASYKDADDSISIAIEALDALISDEKFSPDDTLSQKYIIKLLAKASNIDN